MFETHGQKMLKNKPFLSNSYHVTEEGILFINGHHSSKTRPFIPISYSVELLLKVCGHVKLDIIEWQKWIADRSQLRCIHPDVRCG